MSLKRPRGEMTGGGCPWTVDQCKMEVQNWVVTCSMCLEVDRDEYRRLMHYEVTSGNQPEDVIPNAGNTTNVGFDLQQLARQLVDYGVEYNPKRFAADIIKITHPKAALLLFKPGNVVCTGAKTVWMAEFVIMMIAMAIVRLGYRGLRILPGSFQVQNVVASAELPAPINLDKLFRKNQECCTYDPATFPGASLRPKKIDRMTVLVFPSGKIVVTGGKSEEDLIRGLDVTLARIYDCRRVIRKGRSVHPDTASWILPTTPVNV